jgi:flagellin
VYTTGNATAALALIQTAISNLGNVQGAVGAGENLLNYATNLANSQITNLSASESSIKDANIAAEASNLAKAQTLQQSSIAALAQANSIPAAVLKLLQ